MSNKKTENMNIYRYINILACSEHVHCAYEINIDNIKNTNKPKWNEYIICSIIYYTYYTPHIPI